MEFPKDDAVPETQGVSRRHRPLVLVGNNSVDGRLEVGEQRKPDARADAVGLAQHAVVGERVIIEEETRRDVEGDEHVDRVVLVCGQDEEDSKHVQDPAERVQQRNSTRSVCTAPHVTDVGHNLNTRG